MTKKNYPLSDTALISISAGEERLTFEDFLRSKGRDPAKRISPTAYGILIEEYRSLQDKAPESEPKNR